MDYRGRVSVLVDGNLELDAARSRDALSPGLRSQYGEYSLSPNCPNVRCGLRFEEARQAEIAPLQHSGDCPSLCVATNGARRTFAGPNLSCWNRTPSEIHSSLTQFSD